MKGMKAFGKYGSLGFELLGSIAVGYYLGRFLDRKLDTHWIAFAGFLLGCYAGFRALFKAAKRCSATSRTTSGSPEARTPGLRSPRTTR